MAAAADDPMLDEYVHALVLYPNWTKGAIWGKLGWAEREGKAVDRRYRRLRKRLKEIGAGMEWREMAEPGASASKTTYFEVLKDGTLGRQFGVIQHKPTETDEK